MIRRCRWTSSSGGRLVITRGRHRHRRRRAHLCRPRQRFLRCPTEGLDHRHRRHRGPAGGDDTPPLGSRRQPGLVPEEGAVLHVQRMSWCTRRCAWPGRSLATPTTRNRSPPTSTRLRRARHLPRRRRRDRAGAVDPRGRRPYARHQAVRVNTRRGQVVLTSNAADFYEALRREPVPGAGERHRLRRDVAPLAGSGRRPRPWCRGTTRRFSRAIRRLGLSWRASSPASTSTRRSLRKRSQREGPAAIRGSRGTQPRPERPTRRGGGRPRRSRPRRVAGANHGCGTVPTRTCRPSPETGRALCPR